MATLRSSFSFNRAIAEAKDPESLRQLLHNGYEAVGVIAHERGGEAYVTAEDPASVVLPEANAPYGTPVGARLHARIEAPDGRFITVSADSYAGLDVLASGVKSGQITQDVK